MDLRKHHRRTAKIGADCVACGCCPAQALELADLGLEKNPRSAQLRFSRTVALERLGRTEEAAKALRSLIAEYPEIPEPYNNLDEGIRRNRKI